jgi:hypothetical protein
MPYVSGTVVSALRQSVNLGIFFRLATTPAALRLCLGVNDVPIGIESVDPDGSVYVGAGRLIGIPQLEVLLNGLADRIEFYVDGVSNDDLVNLAPAAASVKGKAVTVGIATLDKRFQPTTNIIPLWSGFADFWSMQRKVQPIGETNPSQMIALSVGTGDLARSRSRRSYWTSAQQKAVSATDEFCDRVARYSSTYEVTWPRF